MTIVHHGDFGDEADLDPVNGPHYGIARRLATPMFPAVHYCADYDADLIAKEVLKSGFKTIALPGVSMMYHGFASRLKQQLGAIHYADISNALDDLKADMIGQTIEMQKFTLDLLKPGARCSDIFAEYNAAMKKRGFQGGGTPALPWPGL